MSPLVHFCETFLNRSVVLTSNVVDYERQYFWLICERKPVKNLKELLV